MRVLQQSGMKVVPVRLPQSLNARLQGLAKRRRQSKSAIIREVLEAHVSGRVRHPILTTAEMVGDLIGCLKGAPRDLSTNKKYMEGFGR